MYIIIWIDWVGIKCGDQGTEVGALGAGIRELGAGERFMSFQASCSAAKPILKENGRDPFDDADCLGLILVQLDHAC